ncbi:MAG: PilX N-terminal domain-containing pilus assembly protein [Thermodesulfobacteriota bacterium]|nr:PilX N-terminal domain-containing pilus assembly protein [Thermodesulfobacteriota bacterium]
MKIQKQHSTPLNNQKGMVLVVSVLLLSALIILGTTAVMQTSTDLKISRNYKMSRQVFYAAEGGVEYGIAKLSQELRSVTPNVNITPPLLSGFTFSEFSFTQVGASYDETQNSGSLAGLSSYCRDYEIVSAVRGNGNAAAKIVATVKDIMIPLFQFGILYEQDLEILPGGTMTFTGGKIHSNQDIYLSPDWSATLSIASTITTAGDIFHKRKDLIDTEGTILIKDGADQYQEMTIDSENENWATSSQDIWNGRVKSQDHGVQQLKLTLSTSDPREILGTGTGSLYSKSGLRIIDGVARDKNDNVVDLTYTDPENPEVIINPLSTATFYDKREGKTVTVTQVNMEALMGSSSAMTKLADPPEGGDENILYVSSSSNSVRLNDGASLPSAGMTVASDRPLYIQGNYNESNNPAAVIADAITVLSSEWNDADSYSNNLNDRRAQSTIVNTAIIGGNKNTSESQYSGGAENFIRFLENWSGKTLTYSGSLVCLWESQYATGNWRYGSPVYTAPTRNWSYGVDPNWMPPGTPQVRTLEVKAWRQIF